MLYMKPNAKHKCFHNGIVENSLLYACKDSLNLLFVLQLSCTILKSALSLNNTHANIVSLPFNLSDVIKFHPQSIEK